MKRIISFLLLMIAFSDFQGCVTDSKSGSPADTTVTPNGARKPRAPKVTYTAFDSLVYIAIVGSKAGEENAYWIYRDGMLLEQPAYRNADSADLYILVDSLGEPGAHTYYVQYGVYLDSLSDKSPAYVYNYAGHSRSGWVETVLMPEQLVRLTVTPPRDEVISAYLIERRIGTAGKEIGLDTLQAAAGPYITYLDTNLVPDDIWVYYRVRAMDAITEAFLPASPWDSIQVKNKVWKYVPSIDVKVSENGVAVSVTNPLGYAQSGAFYYLYRNATGVKDGKAKVDSLPIPAYVSPAVLEDYPDSGAYYYWVEARDPWGRTSARSTPRQIRFTGLPPGPEISSIQVGGSSIQIQPFLTGEAQLYILERTQDTTKPAASTVLDSLSATLYYSFGVAFTDYPTEDGYYFYRITAVDKNGVRSAPGNWRRSDYYRYDPIFGALANLIVNRGDRVQALADRSPDYYYVLYRSKTLASFDTGAVDTLRYSDTAVSLSDVPPVGTWYYRLYRYPATNNISGSIFRTPATRVDFTGKPVGAPILSLNVSATRVDISIIQDPEAIAYILERSADGKDWSVADTVSVQDFSASGALHDRPPADGFWNYRVRTVRKDVSVSEPGAARRTPSAFVYGPAYNNTLSAYIENKGASVECSISPVYGFILYLVRSPSSDYSKGIKVDSLIYPASPYLLADAPSKGTFYYWVQRESEYQGQDAPIYRSVPVKIEFTGAPEITTLTKVSSGIQISIPRLGATDSLVIYRSAGKPDDAASFAVLATIPANGYSTFYIDATIGSVSGFYHYKLAILADGKTGDPGAVKSIYYEPGTVPGLYQGLLKQAGGSSMDF